MENSNKEQNVEKQLVEAEVVHGLDQQTEPKEAKQEKATQKLDQPKGPHHTSSKLSATIHKMFHMEGQVEKSKKTSKPSSSIESEDEKSEASSNQAIHDNIKPRFQKNSNGSHCHYLLPKRGHRLQNFLKDFGHNLVEAQHSQNKRHTAVIDKLPSKFQSELSLSKKYGKPQEVIGKGAFGIVRIAHKTEPKVPGEKLFAVKEFKKRNNEPEKKYIKRLTSEFCISSSLHHINVIDTLDLLQDTQGNYCEVMEYCAAGDLYSLIITTGGLEQEEADCFFGQLINGVKYLHDNGVAHRDLKPENLLLTSDGCLKITDFGNGECFRMAWETQSHLSRGICGSEPYIAPEEFTEDWFDPRKVDVWACGIIYMSMINSSLLWHVAKEKEDCNFKVYLEAKAQGAVLVPFQRLNKERREIMSRIIEPNPNRRITVEQIIANAWFSLIQICHRSSLYPNDSSISSMSCGVNVVNQEVTPISKSSISNIV
ncbi:3878_t:CDS:2 [Funneliformis caledonium]|uniref:non-specific serine/threonine protein kinase n=1 Tax=Funneliformis caledonium TaxID=1117310 RepID=A0A9N9H3I7_9GLOM|nr:3878_t:CDS:2 [Funneliformis caledonium]